MELSFLDSSYNVYQGSNHGLSTGQACLSNPNIVLKLQEKSPVLTVSLHKCLFEGGVFGPVRIIVDIDVFRHFHHWFHSNIRGEHNTARDTHIPKQRSGGVLAMTAESE